MIRASKIEEMKFLEEMDKNIKSKDDIFVPLLEVCGIGEDVNTKHVFLQEVIIKFNASKAKSIIASGVPYKTASHFIDVAIYAYIKAGFNMNDFDKDLQEYKEKYSFLYSEMKETSSKHLNA